MREALARDAPWPAVQAIWAARLDRAAPWFLDGEAERRARGTPRRPRGQGPPRRPRPAAALRRHRPGRPDRPLPRRLRDLRLQVRHRPDPAEAKAFHLQLPLEAAHRRRRRLRGPRPRPRPPSRTPEVRQDRQDPGRCRPRTSLGRGSASSRSSPTTWNRRNGFPARLRPQQLTWASDYDHLSRKGEWADGDEPEESW